MTEGTACTLLHARNEVAENAPLMIANCDQIVDFDCADFVTDCFSRDLDGSILVFREPDRNPKWSYARPDDRGIVVEVAEKRPRSEEHTSELQSLMRISYAVFCLKKKITQNTQRS